MIISLIAAIAANRVIGIKNHIPWHLPADLSWFKCHTFNKPVIMGHKTYKSIGHALPGRNNIVLSNNSNLIDNNCTVTWAATQEQALAAAGIVSEVMVIGGGKIYEMFLSKAKRLYITHINIEVEGDTYFPEYNSNNWRSIFKESHKINKDNAYNYCFEILKRDS